jgi:hypothetical protein
MKRPRLPFGRRERLVIVTDPPRAAEHPAIFLVGCVRSGTSLVRRIVDSHSRIACPPESHFLAPLLGVVGDRRSGLGFEAMGFDAAVVAGRTREFAERFFLEYAAAHGKPRWADKTPFYVDHLDALADLFGPDTRFVLIHRHGLDVARSMTTVLSGFLTGELGAPPGDDVATARIAAGYWADRATRMLDFAAARPAQCHELRYESLGIDAEATVRALFAFLGEEYEPGVLAFNDHAHDDGLEDGRVVRSRRIDVNVGAWRRWSPACVRAAVEVAVPALDRLGYDRPSPAAEDDR